MAKEKGKGQRLCPHCGVPVDPKTGVCPECGHVH